MYDFEILRRNVANAEENQKKQMHNVLPIKILNVMRAKVEEEKGM